MSDTQPGDWIIDPDGAVGPLADPEIIHHPRCCYSKGCHNVCSYMCGTDHAIDPNWSTAEGT